MIRVLAAVARVSDSACSFAVEFQKQMEHALSFGLREGTVTLNFISASERALRASFAGGSWDILHLIAPVHIIPAAHYATVCLESSTGSTRSISIQYLFDLLVESDAKIVVLYSCDKDSSFDTVASALAARCSSLVITANDLNPRELNVFLAKLHAGLANGEMQENLSVQLPGIRVWVSAKTNSSSLVPPLSSPVNATTSNAENDAVAREIIRRKRELGQFDVFLCHNSLDKPLVRNIALQLERSGILPWLDERELPPGRPWIPLLESQIGNIRSAAVFFGSAGIGPWQEEELDGFLRQFVQRRLAVIPVLLPDAPLEPQLPVFLGARGWVDFRSFENRPLDRLIWAITGIRPENL